jgi:lipoyl(octanoyl) transferase
VTSLELESEAGVEVTIERAINATARNFGRVFARQMVWRESSEQLIAPALAAYSETQAL